MFRKLFRRSPKCAACKHPRYRHKMEAILGRRICLNMLCACPDYKDPEKLVGHAPDFGSGVFDFNTIRALGFSPHLNDVRYPAAVRLGEQTPEQFEQSEREKEAAFSVQVQNNVMYDDSGLKVSDIFPEIIDQKFDSKGHPIVEHIWVNGRTYPVEFIQHYLQEDWAMLHSGYASWLEEAYKTEGD